MPEGALTPFTAFDEYRYFAGLALLMYDVTKVGHAHNIYYQRIVLDSYFNFTKKSNLVVNLWYDFFKLAVAYFFGPTSKFSS